MLTASPQTDLSTLSSSVNITIPRDCVDMPALLSADLDIGTVPEISDNEDEDLDAEVVGAMSLHTSSGKDSAGEGAARDPLTPMVEA